MKDFTRDDIRQLQSGLLDSSDYERLSMLFKMFADPTRLKILTALSQNTLNVDNLKDVVNMSQSAISHQLASLRKMDLVRSHKVGKNVYYSLADDHVMQIFQQALDHIFEDHCQPIDPKQ